jgi:glycolate oxidase iron-sulfur subunit
MDSPRGRIYLMKALHEGRVEPTESVVKHLDLCLDCRACETACPSGVQYGHLIEGTRQKIHESNNDADRPRAWGERLMDLVLYELMPYPKRMAPLVRMGQWMQKLGIDEKMQRSSLMNRMPAGLRKLSSMMPPLPPPADAMPEIFPPIGERRARVGFFVGCVSESIFNHTNRATVRVLQKNGCEVLVPSSQGCCGAIHHHGGRAREAARMAIANIASLLNEGVDAIVTNVAGCGAMLKDYDELLRDEPEWAERAEQFVARVKDISEFLDDLGAVKPTKTIDTTAAYHDACHLAHAQQIRDQPRAILEMIPGLKIVPLADSDFCCGAAGSYNLTQPEMAERLAERKMTNIEASGAEWVVAANAGCLLHLMDYARRTDRAVSFAHPIDLLDQAYRDDRAD